MIENSGTGSIERCGTGSIEHGGTGSVEHGGTGSIEHGGTGSIERAGTGSIRRLALAAAFGCFACSAVAEVASYDTSVGTIDVYSNGGEVRISWHYDDGINRQFLVGKGSVRGDYGVVRLAPVQKVAAEGGGGHTGITLGLDPSGKFQKVAAEGGGGHTGVALGLDPSGKFDKVAAEGGGGDGDKVAAEGGGGHTGITLGLDPSGKFEKVAAEGGGGHTGITLGLDPSGKFQKVAAEGGGGHSATGTWGGQIELIFTLNGVEAVATLGEESIVLDLNNTSEFSRAVVYVEGTELF